MRLPKTWDDRSLLDDNPFKESFEVLKLGEKRFIPGVFKKRMIQQLKEKCQPAIKAWVILAFDSPARFLNLFVYHCFVDVFWILFKSSSSSANSQAHGIIKVAKDRVKECLIKVPRRRPTAHSKPGNLNPSNDTVIGDSTRAARREEPRPSRKRASVPEEDQSNQNSGSKKQKSTEARDRYGRFTNNSKFSDTAPVLPPGSPAQMTAQDLRYPIHHAEVGGTSGSGHPRPNTSQPVNASINQTYTSEVSRVAHGRNEPVKVVPGCSRSSDPRSLPINAAFPNLASTSDISPLEHARYDSVKIDPDCVLPDRHSHNGTLLTSTPAFNQASTLDGLQVAHVRNPPVKITAGCSRTPNQHPPSSSIVSSDHRHQHHSFNGLHPTRGKGKKQREPKKSYGLPNGIRSSQATLGDSGHALKRVRLEDKPAFHQDFDTITKEEAIVEALTVNDYTPVGLDAHNATATHKMPRNEPSHAMLKPFGASKDQRATNSPFHPLSNQPSAAEVEPKLANWVHGSDPDPDEPETDHEDKYDHGHGHEPESAKCATGYNAPALNAPHHSGHPDVKLHPLGPLKYPPPIWSLTRQELCESFDWFRSFQSGVYHVNGMVKGYLLGAFSASRDLFHHNGKLIISHGGGKAESVHCKKGTSTLQPAHDQLAQDPSVRALLANYRKKQPIVLIIDDKYALFPYNLQSSGVSYAVLGFYIITSAWAEYQDSTNNKGTSRVIRWKFAFQWCDQQGQPWWFERARYDEEPNTSWNLSAPLLKPEEDPPLHLKLAPIVPTSSLPPETDLPRFSELVRYKPSTPSPAKQPFSKLISNTPRQRLRPKKTHSVDITDIMPRRSSSVEKECSKCHQSSPHVYAQGWVCLKPGCAMFWKIASNMNELPLHNLEYIGKFLELVLVSSLPDCYPDLQPPLPRASPDGKLGTGYAFTRGWHCKKCGRLSSRFKWEHWECSYCGATHHVDVGLHFPNDLRYVGSCLDEYKILPGHDIHVGPLRIGDGMTWQTFTLPEGSGRIHHIRANGIRNNIKADKAFELYQRDAAAGTMPFRRWPLRTHKLKGACKTHYFSHNTGVPYQYVGGTANTVSLDKAPEGVKLALELIIERVKQVNKDVSFNEILSCGYMEKQKMAFHSDAERGLGPLVAGLSMGSTAEMHFRIHHSLTKAGERNKIAMTFILRHGDILVMDGHGVQECYEHTVVPYNFRFAATARLIKVASG